MFGLARLSNQLGSSSGIHWLAAASGGTALTQKRAIMQNMIFDSVFEVDSVLENKSDF